MSTIEEEPKYIPPLAIGTRVRLTTTYSGVQPGTEGTITWTYPWPDMPYRVKWDGFEEVFNGFGMDDIGWLVTADEVSEVSA